jgi:hypothetical protein
MPTVPVDRSCPPTPRPAGRRRTVRRAVSRTTPVAIIVLGTSMLLSATAYAAQGPVNLETAGSFAVLAGSGITNTGATTVSGDIGTFPTPTETGFSSLTLSGANHDGDAVTQGAKHNLQAAYNDAAGRKPVTNVPVELGGSTLLPGVYTSPTFGLTGTLTLNAKGNPNAEFIFKAGSTLITASDSHVLLINGAQACNVVWQVGSSATFGTDTSFVGNVLSHTSITAETGATFHGRLLALGGAVTLDTNTIVASTCAAKTTPTPTPTPSKSPTSRPTGSPSPSPSGTATSSAHPSATPTATSSKGPTPISTITPGRGHLTPHSPKGPTPPTTPPTTPPLPFTGLPTVPLLGAGLALIVAGAVASIAGRRRRNDGSA